MVKEYRVGTVIDGGKEEKKGLDLNPGSWLTYGGWVLGGHHLKLTIHGIAHRRRLSILLVPAVAVDRPEERIPRSSGRCGKLVVGW